MDTLLRAIVGAFIVAVWATFAALPASAADFTLTVYASGNPPLSVEVSATGFRQTRDIGSSGRTAFAVPGAPKELYFTVRGCGGVFGGSYSVSGTTAARLDIDRTCHPTIHSNQDNSI